MYQRSRKTQLGRIEAAMVVAGRQSQDVENRRLSEIELQDMIDKAERVAHRAIELVQSGQRGFVVCPRRLGDAGYVIKFRDGRQEVVG